MIKKKKNIIPNAAAHIIQNFNPDDIPRCPECNLICSLILNYKDKQLMIEYKYENKHKGNILLDDFMNKYYKYSIFKEKSGECGKTQKEIKNEFVYCSKFNQFLCYECENKHLDYNNHNISNFKWYDSLCKIHSNLFDSYWINCQKNLCIFL